MKAHQYVKRSNARAVPEAFVGDPIVSFLYSRVREDAGWLYKALTSARLTDLLGTLRFDIRPARPDRMRLRYARKMGIDFTECAAPPQTLDTARKVFERQIRYWDCRPMEPAASAIASPADARLLVGSLERSSSLFLKDKFFDFDDLLGRDKPIWRRVFRGGHYAVLRLTPDKYHYNHVPVSGVVRDIYEVDGVFQSCHPAVVIAQATPYSKNRRTVTISETDVPNGSQVGVVAMVEVVALMIGDVVQRYSRERYDEPQPVRVGMHLERGAPKSLFRPGSSTVVLIFEPGRVRFCKDIVANLRRSDVRSHYSAAGSRSLVETDVLVRSTIARPVRGAAR
jgi:phosphatidylserine decarboxylase